MEGSEIKCWKELLHKAHEITTEMCHGRIDMDRTALCQAAGFRGMMTEARSAGDRRD